MDEQVVGVRNFRFHLLCFGRDALPARRCSSEESSVVLTRDHRQGRVAYSTAR